MKYLVLMNQYTNEILQCDHLALGAYLEITGYLKNQMERTTQLSM